MTKVYISNKGMALLNIHTFPDPILRKKALPVTDFDQSLDDTAQSMLETMYVSSGIGLAAIQAGILKQIIVIDLKSGEEDISLREPHIFVNPKILKKYGSTVSEEGCLSVPGYRGLVNRSETVRVKAMGLDGKTYRLNADDLLAQALEHEIDHLNGILYIDHLVSHESLYKITYQDHDDEEDELDGEVDGAEDSVDAEHSASVSED